MEETFEILQVGEGPVAEALARMTDVLGWTTTSATTLDEVEATLPRADAVVVTGADAAVDHVRERFGTAAITRAARLGSDPGVSMPLLPD